jgi:hypothetical protein
MPDGHVEHAPGALEDILTRLPPLEHARHLNRRFQCAGSIGHSRVEQSFIEMNMWFDESRKYRASASFDDTEGGDIKTLAYLGDATTMDADVHRGLTIRDHGLTNQNI